MVSCANSTNTPAGVQQQFTSRFKNSAPEPGYYVASMTIPLEVMDAIGTVVEVRENPDRDDTLYRITDSHALLVGYVGMMVNYKGEGCWATNAYLASKLKKTERRIEQLIRDCKQVGFIIDCGWREIQVGETKLFRRVLETKWNRSKASGGTPKSASVRHPKSASDNKSVFELPRKKTVVRSSPDGVEGRSKPSKTKFPPKGTSSPSSTGLRPSESGLDSSRINDRNVRQESGQPSNKSRPESNGAILAPSASHEGEEHHETNQGSSNMECLPIPDTKKWTDRDEELAVHFHDKIAEVREQNIWYSRGKWADQLRLLRDSLREKEGDSVQDRLERVLYWHISQLGKRGCLRIYCTEMFRKRFLEVEDKMREQVPAVSQISVNLSEDARSILTQLLYNPWPEQAKEMLPGLVQKSLDSLSAFRKKLITADVPRSVSYARNFIVETIGACPNYVERWFVELYESKRNWAEWKGLIAGWEWSESNPKFVADMGRDLEAYGDPKGLQNVLDAIKPAQRSA